ESLSAAGVHTHAVLPREVLRWAGKTLIQRGLRTHDRVITDPLQLDVGSHATGHQTTARGLAALAPAHGQTAEQTAEQTAGQPAHGQPAHGQTAEQTAPAHGPRRFVWLHYFDAHEHHQLQLSDRRLRAALVAT